MAATDVLPGGGVFAGRYRLQRRLGAGGMATVWRASDTHLDRPVAVKVLSDTLAGEDSYVARFEREARLAAGLSHPRLVQVFDYGSERGRPFLVMELVDGPTLANLLRTGGARRVDARELAGDLLDALAHVHDAGIVHRDVKPANVLMAADGRARLTDFGVARPAEATELTGTGLVIGTLRYLAPEVVAGQPATPRSDLFALGRLLREVADAHGSGPRRDLAPLIERLACEDPADRPGSAREAAALLDREASAPTPATTVPARVRARPRAVRRRPRRAVPTRTAATTATAPVVPSHAPARRARALAFIAAIAVAGAIIVAVALARSGGGPSGPPRPPAAGAPLARQLDAIGRALDSTGR